MRNFSVSDKYVPFPLETKFVMECRHMFRTKERKVLLHAFTWKAFGFIKKGIM